MQSSLSWVEWIDRLNRVLEGAREDVRALLQSTSPQALAAIERSRRQLSALTDDLRRLDRSVLAAAPDPRGLQPADNLHRALDTAVFQLGTLSAPPTAAGGAARARARRLAAIDSALRDGMYEAAMLFRLNKRRA